MKNIIIKSLKYNGEEYFYKNDNFRKGINIVLGENKHGKTTFTYLIMYALGISVPAFTDEKAKTLDQVFKDSNNYVYITVIIDNVVYTFKRKIKENVVSIIQEDDVLILPIDRRNGLFDNESKTFSDWLLEKLDIELIRVENIFSSEHYLNFDDLFRFSYYDQKTSKQQMISDFGTGRNILKKTSQIKKFIFETLLSYSNHEYYYQQKKVKDIEDLLKDKKNELDLEYKVHNLFTKGLKEIDIAIEDISKKILYLEARKKDIINYPKMVEGKKDYITDLRNELETIQINLINDNEKIKKLRLELANAKKIDKIERKEIKSLEVLATLPNLCGNLDESCPLCGHKGINDIENDKLNVFHFKYSKADYIDILKSKISSNKTTQVVIEDLKEEIENIGKRIEDKEKEIKEIMIKIKSINSEIIECDIEESILKINEEIDYLTQLVIRSEVVNRQKANIEDLEEKVKKIREELRINKEKLNKLEFEKYDILQMHIDRFEEIFNEYLKNYYEEIGEEYDYKMFLNKDYIPTTGKYQPHSTMTEIKIFFYLTMLKYSMENKKINYPKLLIIDTIKDHGMDNKRIEKILEQIFEFEGMDCQIIMTCGYEEFENFFVKKKDMIIEQIDDNKLLKRK